MPKDFFSDDLSKVSFLNDSLQSFFELTDEPTIPKKLKLRVTKLKEMLLKEYDFKPRMTLEERLMQQVKIEDNEDLPVIVNENEEFISF